ncbi:MAG: tRNA 4-thiouridine(8) synthase ThiI [Oscillospiraceae bacterium]|nr:tRNA 4-thiouridine(8) synthase ThiI [Oscillospiraceae bacterium]
MREILLIKDGEIALKGLNKSTFENILVKNIRRRIEDLGKVTIQKAQSTIYVKPAADDYDADEALERLKKVFGIAALSKARMTEKRFDKIAEGAVEYLSDLLPLVHTFKVEAKRADKSFPMTSPELCAQLGGILLSRFHNLKVNVQNPDVIVTVEIRDFGAYIHAKKHEGAGGMPIGSSGKALLLISGGIDSPVAGYMMAKRGIEVSAVHFISPPYTSDRALQKVENLCEKMCEYMGRIPLYIVPFTEIQEEIRKNCPEELFTLIMRRMMMKIALRLAKENGMQALITGESVGQVASQTIGALACTDAVCDMPVFRPLIGMDKNEIIEVSRKIDTFETSIQPYEDCCTVFTPKHPKTRPQLSQILEAEALYDFEPLLERAVEGIRLKRIDMNR